MDLIVELIVWFCFKSLCLYLFEKDETIVLMSDVLTPVSIFPEKWKQVSNFIKDGMIQKKPADFEINWVLIAWFLKKCWLKYFQVEMICTISLVNEEF